MTDKLFGFAGVSRHTDGVMTFRTTTRDGYAAILTKEGKTDVMIVALNPPLNRVDAAKAVATNKKFTAEARKIAEAVVNGPVKTVAPKAPKAVKLPKAAVKATKSTSVDTAEVKAANLEKIKAAAARVNAKKAAAAKPVDGDATNSEEVTQAA